MRLLRIIGALLLVAGLAACSTVKLAYGSLDNIAYWWLDGYLDFTDDQAQRVKDDLARLQRWHRSDELPRIADLLQRMEQAAPGPMSADQACGFVTPIRERLLAIADQAEGPASMLARDLKPEQLAHMEQRYRRRNAEFQRDFAQLAPGELREKRAKEIAERGEMLYGKLTDGQRAAIEEFVARSVFDPARVASERLRRQQDTLQVLRRMSQQRPPLPEARAMFRDLVQRLQVSPDPAYRAYQEAQLREGCALFAVLHERATPAQREGAARRLRGWQRDLRELAAAK